MAASALRRNRSPAFSAPPTWSQRSNCVGFVPFLVEQPFPQLERFTFVRIIQQITTRPAAPATKTVTKTVAPTPPPSPVSNGEFGGTDSSKIRLLVWRGAIDIWLHNPIFGSGLETYAFAYYQYRPDRVTLVVQHITLFESQEKHRAQTGQGKNAKIPVSLPRHITRQGNEQSCCRQKTNDIQHFPAFVQALPLQLP